MVFGAHFRRLMSSCGRTSERLYKPTIQANSSTIRQNSIVGYRVIMSLLPTAGVKTNIVNAIKLATFFEAIPPRLLLD